MEALKNSIDFHAKHAIYLRREPDVDRWRSTWAFQLQKGTLCTLCTNGICTWGAVESVLKGFLCKQFNSATCAAGRDEFCICDLFAWKKHLLPWNVWRLALLRHVDILLFSNIRPVRGFHQTFCQCEESRKKNLFFKIALDFYLTKLTSQSALIKFYKPFVITQLVLVSWNSIDHNFSTIKLVLW